jgi:hypothetical protein
MFAVKRYVRGSTPVARPCHRCHLGRTLKVISQPRFWSTGVRRFYLVTLLSWHSRQAPALRLALARVR